MATYAIGDIQGCYGPLLRLLKAIHFNPTQDQLWLTGDLVNRGPESLDVLRFLTNLPKLPTVVLGNHDLHLLACASGAVKPNKNDTIQDILSAHDSPQLCEWLRQQPLIHHDPDLNFTMVHAGIAPQWDLSQACHHADEVHQILKNNLAIENLLRNLYGDQPRQWQQNLTGWQRIRFIINSFTRMRYCSRQGKLNFKSKSPPGLQPINLLPWFSLPNRKTKQLHIIFGHWAALDGLFYHPHVIGLDTGCVWGGKLTAFCLESKQFYQVAAR